jgi:hypothetical protein
MSHIQIELSEEEDDILKTFMWLKDEENKRSALKKLIVYSKKIKEIEDALKIKQKLIVK